MRVFEGRPWLWVLAAFLIASPRLFEQGISLDPALYAVVARNFSVDGDFWNLKFGESLFPQFFEQPFLIFWLQGGIFKILGASDYTTRILGLGFGAGTFYFLYRLVELLSDKFLASICAFLCLLDVNFVGRFATLYLEVPLTFFALGSLYFFIKAVRSPQLKMALAAGAFFSGACLTKGFAALPTLGTLGLSAVSIEGWRIIRRKEPWVGLATAVVPIILFCVVQDRLGKYSFTKLYFQNTFLERTLSVGAGIGPVPFLQKFVVYAGLPLVLAFISLIVVAKTPYGRLVFKVGFIGAVMSTIAGAVLGFPYLHYYHGILPFLHMMASVCVAKALSRQQGINWMKIALLLGVCVQVFWNVVPFSMRRKAPEDFYELKAVMSELAKMVSRADTLEISEADWVYRQYSLWYWGLDSQMKQSLDSVTSNILVTVRPSSVSPAGKGFRYCRGSKRYDVWVRDDNLLKICNSHQG